MTDNETIQNKKILVLGLEKKTSLQLPTPIQFQNGTITFEKYDTAYRLNEYDGVVIFQGIFEKFKWIDGYMESRLEHKCDSNELDKRKKEANLLLEKGGFICFLLTDRFIDQEGHLDFRRTDLAKRYLNYSDFYRKNFQARSSEIECKVNEFKKFLDVYGAANSYFTNHNKSLDIRVIATTGSDPASIIIDKMIYFIPSLLPDKPEVLNEYFSTLVDGLVACHNKSHLILPSWVSAFKFSNEPALVEDRDKLCALINDIDAELSKFESFKAVLFHSGSELVLDVKNLFEQALGITVDTTDDLREDIKLIDSNNNVICVCEIKGVNRSIKRENVNQTDSHRERSGFNSKFPALLIANTHIKTSNTIEEKDQELSTEQICHAVRMNVLLLRTLDLLNLARMVLAKEKTRDEALSLLLTNVGWLRIKNSEIHIINGE